MNRIAKYFAGVFALAMLAVLAAAPAQADDRLATSRKIYQLGESRDAGAVSYLLAQVNASDAHIRRAAAHALGKIGDERAVSALHGLLASARQPTHVKRAAAAALGKIGSVHSLDQLMETANCDCRPLHESAMQALRRIVTKSQARMAS